VVTILIFIYPLKAIFGAMWYLLSDGRLGQPLGLHTSAAEARAIFALYALGLIGMAVEIWLLYLRAWQLRDALRLNARESSVTRGELVGWSIPICVGIVALVLALTLPIERIEWAGWVYFSMAILVPAYQIVRRRRVTCDV
jgi:hypothetical protein